MFNYRVPLLKEKLKRTPVIILLNVGSGDSGLRTSLFQQFVDFSSIPYVSRIALEKEFLAESPAEA